jgi:3-dehydroquinate synthase
MAERRTVMSDSVELVEVELAERSYTVSIGQGLLGRMEELLARPYWRRVAVVTDDRVGPLYGATVVSRLKGAGLETFVLEIPSGEPSKTADRAVEIVESLIDSGLTRSDAVFALGGGVVGDLAGFASSVFKRGIDLVQVPTSLLAQVDSSVGGKTAVNVPAAKNQVGTFHQPVAVICDITTLGTLPEQEFRAGLAEVAKYSVLTSRPWGRDLAGEAASLERADAPRLVRLVKECVREKAALVSADEFDHGVRHHLNYGHTLGHALEAEGGYGELYSHGEGVAIGMVFAALVSEAMGLAEPGLADRHRRLLADLALPTAPAGQVPEYGALAGRMALDKKSTGDTVMVLLESEGKPVVKRGIDSGLMEDCYARLIS